MCEYNIAIVLLPMGVVGSVCAAILASIFPELLLITVNTIILIFIAFTVFNRLMKMRSSETRQR